jgi:hypothetical protein
MAPTALTRCRSSLGLLIPGPRSTTTPAGAICCEVGSLLGEEHYECLDDGSRNGHARLRKISGNCRGAGRMAPRLFFCTPQRSSHGELGSWHDLSQNYVCDRLETSVYKPWSKPLPRSP